MSPKPTVEDREEQIRRLQQQVEVLRQREKTLRLAETRFQTLFDNLPIAVYLLDKNGRLSMQNAACRTLWGDIDGKYLDAVATDKKVVAFWRRKHRRALSGKTIEDRISITVQNKRMFYDIIIGPVFENGQITSTAGVIIDVSRRNRAEERLQKHDRFLHALMEYVPEGICLFDVRKEGVRLCSREALLIAGITQKEAHQRLHAFWNPASLLSRITIFRPNGTPLSVAELPLTRAVEQGEVMKDEEVLLRRPDGRLVPLLCNAAPVYDESGKITGGILAYRDITERKQMETKLQSTLDELEALVEERTSHLKDALDELLQKEKALRKSSVHLKQLSSELLQAQENERKRVANEVHDSAAQVLAGVKYRLESVLVQAQKRGRKSLIESIKGLLPVVQCSIEDMRRLMMELRPTILDDMGIIAAIEWYRREFEATYSSVRVDQEIRVEEEAIPNALKIVIFRIVQEALSNVGKHSDATLVRITLKEDTDELALAVEDNGRGFDVETAQQIKAFGRGLGLSSMRERVQYSGGTFAIESAQEMGTRIEAVWPKSTLV